MIPATIWLCRDREDPRIYRIAVSPGHNATINSEAEVIPWNEARETLSPEVFHDQCRMAFADWCARNPELVEAVGL